MLRKYLSLLVLVLTFVLAMFLAPENISAQKKIIPVKPFNPYLSTKKGIWKIVKFWTKPQCYTVSSTRDVPIEINAIFECTGKGITKPVTCEDLTLKFYWHSNIEKFTKKINLTQAIRSFCGPKTNFCKVRLDGDVLEVKIDKKTRRISIRKVAYVSPRVRGDIDMTMEIFTGVTLTDSKKISLSPCSVSSRGYDATADFSQAGTGYIKITITDLDKAGAATINAFVKTSHPAFSGQVTFTEETTNPGVFSRVQPFVWTQGVSCEVTYIDERTSSGRTNVQRVWRYVVP